MKTIRGNTEFLTLEVIGRERENIFKPLRFMLILDNYSEYLWQI
jgi:hypothetical protein